MKKKINLLPFLLLLSATMSFWGCPRKKIEYIYVPDEVKAYTVFPVGSYWIYKDSVSGATDSVYRTSLLSRMNSEPESYIETEIIQMAQKRSYYGDSIRGGVEVPYPNLPKHFRYYMNSGYAHFFCCAGYLNGVEQATFEPYKPGYDTGFSKYVGYWETDTIDSQIYYKVRAYQINYEEPSNPIRSYYASGIGLIRAEMQDGKVWKLLRYKIAP